MEKFFGVVGNPPYQVQAAGEQRTFQKPIYDRFLDASFEVGDHVALVHPARFLFNAGSTPKAWNKKMLEDEHLSVLDYREDASSVFEGTEIKGGVAVTFRDADRTLGPIGAFVPHAELRSIMDKVVGVADFKSFSTIVVTRTAYRFTDAMHTDFPEAAKQLSRGHAYDVSTNIFKRLPQVFFEERPDDGEDYIQILGREGASRAYKYVRRRYIRPVVNLDTYKLFMPKANATGKFGEVLTKPILGKPATGATETFISIGTFSTQAEAENASKYIATKFARALLGILKVTQDISPEKWGYVPLQDFSETSDIGWSGSAAAIDKQLFAKYGLDDAEVRFIEGHVKNMD